MKQNQLDIFGAGPALPEGFRYEREVVSREQERELLEIVPDLPFKEFQFHGFVGKRRTVSYGWHYDFNERVLRKTDDMPAFLVALRKHAAAFAGMAPEQFQHVLVTQYSDGAGIGWHKDKAVFGEVIGISLLSPCTFRLRRKQGDDWERVSLEAEPRSAYLISGASRTDWEHSIPGVDALRYSITYRNLREP